MKVISAQIILFLVLLSANAFGETISFLGVGSRPASNYLELVNKIACAENSEDCDSRAQRIKLKQELVAFRHWALGMLSLQLYNFKWATKALQEGVSTEQPNDWAMAVSRLSDSDRNLVFQQFFDKIENASKLRPDEKFGSVVYEVGFWFIKEFLPKQDNVCSLLLTSPM